VVNVRDDADGANSRLRDKACWSVHSGHLGDSRTLRRCVY
jgi:hypothetical protein